MGGFVVVVVAAHQAFGSDVFGVFKKLRQKLHDKKGVDVANKAVVAAHGLDETFYIVRHIK